MDWSLEVVAPRGDLLEKLYEAANVWCNSQLPPFVQATASKGPQEQMAAAQTADTVMYQIRSTVAMAIGIAATVGGPGTEVHVSLAGRASAGHVEADFVKVSVWKEGSEPEQQDNTTPQEDTTGVTKS